MDSDLKFEVTRVGVVERGAMTQNQSTGGSAILPASDVLLVHHVQR